MRKLLPRAATDTVFVGRLYAEAFPVVEKATLYKRASVLLSSFL